MPNSRTLSPHSMKATLTKTLIAITTSAFITSPVYAEPPPWAPAHGNRAKHHHHEDDDGDEARYPTKSYLVNGSCNRTALGAVLGGVAGGIVGAQIGKGSGKD